MDMANFNTYLHLLSDLLDASRELGFPAQAVVNDLIVLDNVTGRRATYTKAIEIMGPKRKKIKL